MGEVREQQAGKLDDTTELLRRLVDDRLFTVAYQPIVDVASGQLIACEALARPSPESGFANPGELLSAAAGAGRVWEVESVLRSAALEGVREFDREVSLFVNCSPDVFADPRFAESFARQAHVAGVEPARVVLEVTEATHERREAEMTSQVARLKALGFAVAIDDVGAGTSGLSRLVSLRPDWLKLDRGLIHGIHGDEFRKNLVRFFGHFARLSGVRVIAEGVETFEDLAAVASLGVRYTQGYHIARPGAIATVLSSEQASLIAAACAEANWAMPEAAGLAGLRRLIQPARGAQAALFVSQAAGELMRSPALDGLAVFDGRRVLGWISREDVLSAARQGGKKLLGACVRPSPSVVSAEMSLGEAVELLCMRGDEELADPLVVVDDADLAGIVRARDLLRAICRQSDRTASSTALLGFAGRAAADQHIADLLTRSRARPGSVVPADALIVDVQGMADFNAAYGYDLGDVVIHALADSVRDVYPAAGPGTLCAHLGDDRFAVIGAGAGDRTAVHALERAFVRRTTQLLLGNDPRAPGSVLSAGRDILHLRFLLIHDLASRLASPRDLPVLERQLREKASTGGAVERVGSAALVIDNRDAGAQRRSA